MTPGARRTLRSAALPLLLAVAACQRAPAPADTAAPSAAVKPSATPAAALAYVPNQRAGTISVIDTGTDTVLRTLSAQGQLGKRLQQILPGPSGHLYVIDAQGHRLLELDTLQDRVLRSVDIGENAEGIAASPDGRQFAVCVEGQNQVMLIDPASFAIGARIATQGQAPEHCVYSPDGALLLTSNEGSDDLDVIDLKAGKSTGVIATSGHPRGMGFAADGNTVYVAQETANAVDVIDLVARRRVASIPAGQRTAGIAISRDGRRVYASNGGAGTVSVIDTAARSTLAEIPVGQRPWNPALSANGRKLYVANGRSNSVSVIDTASMKEIKQIAVGDMPWGVVIAQ
ncbi:beta-propeller fold lactonase family protein [Xanthomonas translucens pv. graminis]|uniref:beta-propeller fold lactonase family protein n=1 Tax=Xanthomonas graminis TaxID=3390026 RepID=UPI0025422AD9|nr:beta-propeller fold lactonase family protein [Xanthomonas translucens]WIH05592.1 beta-propeller fold lactonase family protein [Xanthomonas translucens pv. graminis]